MNYDISDITKAYNKYISLLRKFFPDAHADIDRLENDFGTRLAASPRETTPDKGGYPGGLVAFTLNTAKHCKVFNKNVDLRSLLRVALVHELGKLGATEHELFLVEESDWHRDKLGRHYKYNDSCPKMSTAHRSLYYAAQYGLHLSEDEWVAVATSAGFQYDENRFYASENLVLAQSLHAARAFALCELAAQS